MNNLLFLLTISLIIIIIFGILDYNVYIENNPTSNVNTWFWGNNRLWTWSDIAVGMLFGILFGFIDNIGLYLGMDTIEEELHNRISNPKIIAGLGNTYGGIMSAFLGTFINNIFVTKSQIQLPLIVTPVGIFLGSIAGVFIPIFFQTMYNRYIYKI